MIPIADLPPQQQERIVCSIVASIKYEIPAKLELNNSRKDLQTRTMFGIIMLLAIALIRGSVHIAAKSATYELRDSEAEPIDYDVRLDLVKSEAKIELA